MKKTKPMTSAEFRRYDRVVEHGKKDFVAVSAALQIVQQNWDKYIKVGDALEKIRDGEGWHHLSGCTSFGDYIRIKFDKSRRWGYDAIDASQAARHCKEEFNYIPPNVAIGAILRKIMRRTDAKQTRKLIEECLIHDEMSARRFSRVASRVVTDLDIHRRQENAKKLSQSALPKLEGAAGWIRVQQNDFGKFMAELPEQSVDLVFTDPLWDLPNDRIEELGQHAKRVLKPKGLLAVMTGTHYMPSWLIHLSKHLDYWWTIAYVFDGARFATKDARIGRICWEPVMVFGSLQRGLAKDVVNMTRAANIGNPRLKSKDNPVLECLTDEEEFFGANKEFHQWGKNVWGLAQLIGMLSRPGDVVLDPFCGGGSTLVASMIAESGPRQVLGCDTEKHWADLTRLQSYGVYQGLCSAAGMYDETDKKMPEYLKMTWRLFGKDAIASGGI